MLVLPPHHFKTVLYSPYFLEENVIPEGLSSSSFSILIKNITAAVVCLTCIAKVIAYTKKKRKSTCFLGSSFHGKPLLP